YKRGERGSASAVPSLTACFRANRTAVIPWEKSRPDSTSLSMTMQSAPKRPTTAATRTIRSTRRSEEHTSELQSPYALVCRLLLDVVPTQYASLSLHDALPIL